MRLPRPHLFLIQTTLSIILLLAPSATAQEIANLEHDLSQGNNNSLVQVDADTFALAYQGAGQDGTLKTFTISADGATITAVESVVYETDATWNNSLVQIDTDTYAIAYSAGGDDGFITTLTVSSDGTTITEEYLLEHDPVFGNNNSLVRVDADTYALAYSGDGFDGYLKTFSIPADGSLITEVTSLEHDEVYGKYNSLVRKDTGIYVLAYTGDGSDGYIKTFAISDDGTSITEVASLEHDTTTGFSSSLIQVGGDIFALAYGSSSTPGIVKTFTVSDDGTSITELDRLEHDAVQGRDNSLIQVDATTFALAYAGEDWHGHMKIFTISGDGTSITETVSLQHDAAFGGSNALVHVNAPVFTLAYEGNGNDGFIKTFDLSAMFVDGFESGDTTAW